MSMKWSASILPKVGVQARGLPITTIKNDNQRNYNLSSVLEEF